MRRRPGRVRESPIAGQRRASGWTSAVLALSLLASAPATAQDKYVSYQEVTEPFQGAPSGPLLPYTPFDGAQGLLVRADVTIEGALDFTFFIPTGTDGIPEPYTFYIDQELEASAPALGFGFLSGVSARLVFNGYAMPLQTTIVQRIPSSYEFSVSRNDDPSGLVRLSTRGVDSPPSHIETRLDHFIDTRCGDPQAYMSAIAMPLTPLVPGLIVPIDLSYTGQLRIEYKYITTDQLQNHVANGDFEGPSLSPWSSSGAGVGRLSSPPQCLAATLNQLLELEAGSLVEVSQSIDTPAAPFTLSFDYGFAQEAGVLEVWIGSTQIDTIAAPGLGLLFRTRMLTVSDPNVLGQSTTPLRIVWDAATGERAYVDNVQVYDAPEPSRELLTAAALLGLAGLARWPRTGRVRPRSC